MILPAAADLSRITRTTIMLAIYSIWVSEKHLRLFFWRKTEERREKRNIERLWIKLLIVLVFVRIFFIQVSNQSTRGQQYGQFTRLTKILKKILKVETFIKLFSWFVNYAFIYSKIDIVSASLLLLCSFSRYL